MAWVLPSDPSVSDFLKASWGQAVYDSLVFTATVFNTTTGVIQAGLVNQASLATAVEAYSTAGAPPADTVYNFTNAAQHGFNPLLYYTSTGDRAISITAHTGHTSTAPLGAFGWFYVLAVSAGTAGSSGTPTRHVLVRYVTASKPWPFLGEDDYGQFLMAIVDKTSSEPIMGWAGDDAPWFPVYRDDIIRRNVVGAGQDVLAERDHMKRDWEGLLGGMEHPFTHDLIEHEGKMVDPLSVPNRELVMYDLRGRKFSELDDPLAMLHMGELPEANNATRCLSDDKAHPDHKHLPQIPGLFIKDTDGSPPLVRVMTSI